MATEKLISAGVFTNENDSTFLPAGVGEIGGAFIGPTLKGPALVPTKITSFAEFEVRFGGLDLNSTYVPYAVKSYLKNAASAYIVRILGNGGWSFKTTTNKLAAIAAVNATGSGGTVSYRIISGLQPAKNDSDASLDARASYSVSGTIGGPFNVVLSGSGVAAITKSLSINPQSSNYITKVLGTNPDATMTSATSYSNGFYPYVNFTNYNQELINDIGYYTVMTGSTVLSSSMGLKIVNITSSYSSSLELYNYNINPAWSTLTAIEQATIDQSAGTNNLFRIEIPTASLLGLPDFNLSAMISSSALSGISIYPNNYYSQLNFRKLNYISGGILYTFVDRSLMPASQSGHASWQYVNGQGWRGYIPVTNIGYPGIVSVSSSTFISASYPVITVITSSYDVYYPDYNHASTPWITSGLITSTGIASITQNLFKVHHLSDGEQTNRDIKISITNLREFVSGSYSTFDLLVRSYSDSDLRPVILEQYRSVNLDPDSPQYIARVIGDKYSEYDTASKKVYTYGNYNNISKFIRIEVDSMVESKAISPTLSPRGFRKLNQTYIGFSNADMIPSRYVSTQNTSIGSYNSKVYLGWDFSYADNENYLKPVPTTDAAGNNPISDLNSDFVVDNYYSPINAYTAYSGSLATRVDVSGITGPISTFVQFTVPMQGGCDGISPAKRKLSGENITSNNSFGFDLSTATSTGTLKYVEACDLMSNQDMYDINMIVAPGVIRRLHPYVSDYIISTAEDRQDTFAIIDVAATTDSVETAVEVVNGMDTNYAATYFPWIKILDTASNRYKFVPPSAVIPGVISLNDSTSAEWYAPAGLTRGGVTEAVDVKIPLSKADKDLLYGNNINPIAPSGTGIYVWGQKTLQYKESAMQSINVRRMLITVKKYIASVSKYLVFEHNTSTTRNRFLNLVNPYLESVQSRMGLYAFKVVMDDTNNDGAVIDRKMLVGDIYLQPTRVAEYIIINFNVTPTGASFND